MKDVKTIEILTIEQKLTSLGEWASLQYQLKKFWVQRVILKEYTPRILEDFIQEVVNEFQAKKKILPENLSNLH